MADRAAKRPRLKSATSVAWTPPVTTFTWTLEDLTAAGFAAAKEDDKWTSDAFDACGLRWQLACKPQHRQVDGVSGCYFSLDLLSNGPVVRLSDDSELKVCVSLIVEEETSYCLDETFSLLEDPGHRTGVQVFLKHSQLCPHAGQVCTVTITALMRARSFGELALHMAPAQRFQSKLPEALSSGDLADVMFKASDGEVFAAHAVILGLSSSIFRALLIGPMAQQPPCIRSPPQHAVPGGLDSDTFRAVLHFMYNATLPAGFGDDKAHMRALLAAADYLDLSCLRETCERRLIRDLAPDNVVEALKLATKLSCALMRDFALRYTAANAHAVMSSADWSSLPPELAADVMHTLAVGEPPFMTHAQPAAGAGAVRAGED